MFYVQTAIASKHTENVCWTGADMSNHQNEEILENLYDEEYVRVRKRWPMLSEEHTEKFAEYFAQKRFEEELD
jgi:hypothetical protein